MKLDYNRLRLNIQQNYNEFVRVLKTLDIPSEKVEDLESLLSEYRENAVSLMCSYGDSIKVENLSEKIDLEEPTIK